jgi:hypothetical protein
MIKEGAPHLLRFVGGGCMSLKDRITRIEQALGEHKTAPAMSREDRQVRIRELVEKSSFVGMSRESLASLAHEPNLSNALPPVARRRRIAELPLKASV